MTYTAFLVEVIKTIGVPFIFALLVFLGYVVLEGKIKLYARRLRRLTVALYGRVKNG